MLRRALIVLVAVGPAALPATSLAYDIKPKTPETAFSKKAAPGYSGHLRGLLGCSRTGDLRIVVQGTRQGGHSGAEIRRYRPQLYRRADFHPSLRPETDRRSAFEQLLVACQRQPRLFRRPKPDLCAGPAAFQGRDGQAGHGQIRRPDHRRKPAPLLFLSRGFDHVGRREVQGSDGAGGDRPAARSENRAQAE